MRNGGWIHLENHLKKLLEGIFFIKISIPNNEEKYRESLGVALSLFFFNPIIECITFS